MPESVFVSSPSRVFLGLGQQIFVQRIERGELQAQRLGLREALTSASGASKLRTGGGKVPPP